MVRERERERETLEKITNTQKRSADIIFRATQIKREREVHTRRLQVPFFCYLFFIFLINQNLFCFYFAVERRWLYVVFQTRKALQVNWIWDFWLTYNKQGFPIYLLFVFFEEDGPMIEISQINNNNNFEVKKKTKKISLRVRLPSRSILHRRKGRTISFAIANVSVHQGRIKTTKKRRWWI